MPRNRRLPPHLEIRRAGFLWRRRWPRVARDGARKTSRDRFLSFSLRTHVLREAKILAARHTELSDTVFAAAAEMTMAISPDTQARILEQLVRFEIEAFERVRAIADPRSPDVARADLAREEALQATLREALWLGNREVARAPLRHVAAQLGIALVEEDPDWRALAYHATQVLLDVSHERLRRQNGIYEQPTIHFRRAIRAHDEIVLKDPVTIREASVTPAAFATATVSHVVSSQSFTSILADSPSAETTDGHGPAIAPSAAPALDRDGNR